MRVVHVNCARDHIRRTGPELLDAWPTLTAVAGAARSAGVDVAVVQSAERDGVGERDGVPVHFVSEPWLGSSFKAGHAPLRLARSVEALKPDLVHLNGLGFAAHTRAICARGLTVLAQDHGSDPHSAAHALRRWGLARIGGVAFTSEEQASPFFANKTLEARTPVFAIPESSTRFQAGDVEDARRATGVHGNPAILWIGHLNENKDPLTILEGFARANLTEAHLWCCYREAPLLNRVRAKLAQDSNLASRVHLLGEVKPAKVELLCRAADFFVLGSRRESCGFALIEALACGATPIVTDIPAFRALTGKGAVGTLCAPGDADAFAGAMVSLARSPIEDLRSCAIAHFRSELSFEVLGRKLAAAYAAVANSGQR
jgi:glycosyltransferase involved in cell wall biosynthesis